MWAVKAWSARRLIKVQIGVNGVPWARALVHLEMLLVHHDHGIDGVQILLLLSRKMNMFICMYMLANLQGYSVWTFRKIAKLLSRRFSCQHNIDISFSLVYKIGKEHQISFILLSCVSWGGKQYLVDLMSSPVFLLSESKWQPTSSHALSHHINYCHYSGFKLVATRTCGTPSSWTKSILSSTPYLSSANPQT